VLNAPLRYLGASELKIWRPEGSASLRIEVIGERTILAARVKRVFPMSDPAGYLSIQDGAGKEVGILESLDGLDPDARELVIQELDRRYFTPQIGRITELKQDAGMWRFTVETQRGSTEFYVRNWRDSAHETGSGRWQIHSVDGQRYEIPNVERLDVRSQTLLEQLL
jgi:hypothetical protein